MKRLPLALLLAGLAGCSVGPHWQRPATGLPEQWSEPTQQARATPIDAHWWQRSADPLLTSLVQRAVANNLDVRSAANRLQQSRALRQVSAAEQLPGLSGRSAYQRQRNSGVGLNDPSGNAGEAPYELWSAALDASWEIDLWGHVRHAVEAADAQVEISQAERDGVLLSISAETAVNYLRLRGVQAQWKVSQQNLDIARQNRDLTQTRYDNGVTTQLDTANAAAQVATIEARLPTLDAERERLINALSYLLDLPPGALRSELEATQPLPTVVADVPLGLPSQLAQRRPDIQRSEAALRRATAAIGAAQADFYPRVSLGASAGFQAQDGADIGAWNARQWSFGPSLYLPIFQGGRLSGTLQLREQQQQAAALDYRKTVLGAWHEVANAASDYAAEQRHYAALSEAVRQNELALRSARERYSQGATDFINVLNVQRALLETQSAQVNSATQAGLDRIQLYRALGGGWPKG
ncbi:efflux transporter outer membrane subunit [Pseudomonas sp. nanlin1]|uniref:efflux transporter outer membrane subunit n=1 Tax=Pseudomonas sp. nanlin1 TaxID=3040605 RepID=UPI00388FB2B5